MRILVAPQEFKGSLTADEATAAITRGILHALPGAVVDRLPLSDGGPGFVDVMATAIPGSRVLRAVVADPLRRPVEARFAVAGQPESAIVESAQANGLWRLAPSERNPLRADTLGVGQLLLAAAETQPASLLIGVGGSATTDGGSGMAAALGARLLDSDGNVLVAGAASLVDFDHIEWKRPSAFNDIDIVVATDVDNPLVGIRGAARVYGPQKGAGPREIEILEAALVRYANVLRADLGVELASLPGAGAAGGLAGGLVAFLGARLVSGFDVVAAATGLESRLAKADLVVTGEGSYDAQSLQGKVVGRLLALARKSGKPAIVLAGSASLPGPAVFTLESLAANPEDCLARAALLLEELAARSVASLLSERSEF